ncbi:hypothetical protein [Desertimonas flava]|uniref:hypothetical protein n=1 Tax=Desertimonas flava TaxID=2064846 RepID=UPI000E346C61|nr:hypothetical protein [Desertimonas flava]
MTLRCYTSFTVAYLAKARVLAESVRRHHPEWEMNALLCEPVPDWFRLEDEPFDAVVSLEDLDIPALAGWVFMHDVVETCTGAKGAALAHLLARPDTDAVVYLDPDVEVFSRLDAVTDALDAGSIVLTPHQLRPESNDVGVFENEVTALVHGVYNLGFLAVAADQQGLDFAAWWRDRLVDYCFDDRMSGLFTDQRWCDLIPALFDRHVILRSSSYNVAPWNVGQRSVSRADDSFVVNDLPLAFFHFSGVDGEAGRAMLERHGADSAVYELWEQYSTALLKAGQDEIGGWAWPYDRFSDGTPITAQMRSCYRHMPEVRAAFADPFAVDESAPTFLQWWRSADRSS